MVGVDGWGNASSSGEIPAGVRCPMCGAGSHPAAAFCAVCGARLQPRGPSRAGQGRRHGDGAAMAAPRSVVAPTRWEYTDARIDAELYPLEDGFLDHFDQAVTEALSRWGAEGWEPAQSLDWRDVVAHDRFAAGLRAPRWWPFASLVGGRPVVRQVLVRLRRAG